MVVEGNDFSHTHIYSYGLEKDTNMTDKQYDQGLAVFYATYIVRFVLTPSGRVYLYIASRVH